MPADEEYALITEMLRNNGGCRLPCWWGFTPGETPGQTVETFFALQGKTLHSYSDTQVEAYSVDYHLAQYNVTFAQSYAVDDGMIRMIYVGVGPPLDQDNWPAYQDPQFIELWRAYLLPQVLEVYGRPEQVLLETYNTGGEAAWPFKLWLLYPTPGFLVEYEGIVGEKQRGTWVWIEDVPAIPICPRQSTVRLFLWSPEHDMTFEDIVSLVRNPVAPDQWRHLEEATGMSIEQFYRTFVQPDNQVCLETPADMW